MGATETMKLMHEQLHPIETSENSKVWEKLVDETIEKEKRQAERRQKKRERSIEQKYLRVIERHGAQELERREEEYSNLIIQSNIIFRENAPAASSLMCHLEDDQSEITVSTITRSK